MAKALLEFETLDAEQIADIMSGKPPRPPKPSGLAGAFDAEQPTAARRARPRRLPPPERTSCAAAGSPCRWKGRW